jgi:precorrin-6B methylase 2
LNSLLLAAAVQEFILEHLKDDISKIAMSKSPFEGIEAKELANQISAKRKSEKKLPTWFNTPLIYFPSVLSIEQTSSELTAHYKASLAIGETLLDLTAGFGVDSYYFSKRMKTAVHCEIEEQLLNISKHNGKQLGVQNIAFKHTDGLDYLSNTTDLFDTIYIDPVRRGLTGKVFMLKDCTPDVVANLAVLLKKSKRLIIKTAPMLDLTAGLNELKSVSEIHIVSVRNEVKELLWILEEKTSSDVKITAVTINDPIKTFSFNKKDQAVQDLITTDPSEYLYEPDAALLKSGAFNLIGSKYGLRKLHSHTQLYASKDFNSEFPGRIFKIVRIISPGELKKQQQLYGNVIVRNYRDKPEQLIKKFKIKPDDTKFLIFTETVTSGFVVIEADIIQHY